MMASMLELRQLSTHYGAICAVNQVSLHVDQGEIVSLIGSNGAGKTTLLMTVCGSPRASGGHVLLDGRDITHLPSHHIMRQGIAVSPEGRRVFPALTVTENLQMGGFFLDKGEIQAGIEHVFGCFRACASGPPARRHAVGRRAADAGHRPRADEQAAPAAAGRAHAGPGAAGHRPDLRDHPTMRAGGVTVFLVEQNANKALQIADRGYVLENGRLVLEDTGANLLKNDAVRQAYLGVERDRPAGWRRRPLPAATPGECPACAPAPAGPRACRCRPRGAHAPLPAPAPARGGRGATRARRRRLAPA
jgi:branched-chain amino acid transport system ATP-binding protein